MSADDRPLPTPPRSRFGRPLPEGEGASEPLTADRMAQAAAAGQLEEFLQHEIPEGEHARNLALMMMGMSGLMPMETPPGGPPAAAGAPDQSGADTVPPPSPGGGPPSDSALPPGVVEAIRQADVAGLTELLRAEHAKRSGTAPADADPPSGAMAPPAAAPSPTLAPGGPPAAIDAALVDELIRIAADNQVSVDWLVLRAVKLYVEDYRKSGRL